MKLFAFYTMFIGEILEKLRGNFIFYEKGSGKNPATPLYFMLIL
jgi:hypothetical protein